MKVLLVKPYNLSDHIQPSLGLGYLATAIRHKHIVRLIDCIKEEITTPEGLREEILSFKPDVLGLQCYTFHLKFIKEAFTMAKEINKDLVCVVGGPHPSAVPKETMEWFSGVLDYGFSGEAEIGFPKLLDILSFGGHSLDTVPGLIWRRDGQVKVNEAKFLDNLDELGFPAWDMIHPETYPEAQHGAFFEKFPIAPIMVTRGCPYPCSFCAGSKVSGKKIRKHSVKYVLDHIELLRNDFGIQEFHIVDDNFTFDMDYAKELLRGLIARNLNMSWATPNGVRLDRLDHELLALMKESGLHLVSVGIESGSDRVLKLMKKGTNIAQIKSAVTLIRSAGIDVAGFFILGYPGETKKDMSATIRFACSLDLIRANFFTYLPFPGTDSFNQIKESGDLDNINWDDYYFTSASYASRGLKRKEIKYYQRKAFLRFFLRPKIFYKNIIKIKSLRHFGFIFMRFYHWILKS